MSPAPQLTIGIEEEYLLVDLETRNLLADPPHELWAGAYDRIEGRVSRELLRAQIEVGTRPHSQISDVAHDLRDLRRTLGEVSAAHGAAIVAASSFRPVVGTGAERGSTKSWPRTSRWSVNEWSSAGCTSTRASRIRNCVSTS